MTDPQWTIIRPLNAGMDFAKFTCGDRERDAWIQGPALEWQEKGKCRVHVAIDERREDTIVGFFSLHCTEIRGTGITGQFTAGALPEGKLPCIMLGNFGVDRRFRGINDDGLSQGVLLVREAIRTAKIVSETVGARFVLVQTKPPALVEWYRRIGFVLSSKDTNRAVDALKNLVFDLHRL